ncbi:MAG: hypothetical protein HFH66_08205 [Lachnospiraceae bacterium]|nr:hypothetical protein [Lachnospiraceae bacterium]
MEASIPLTKELHYIKIILNSFTINENRAENYYLRHKQYTSSMPTGENPASHDILLETILPRINGYAAKITQEMHRLNFTSINPVPTSPDRPGYKTAHSFKKLLTYGEDQNLPYDKSITYATYKEAQQALNSWVTRNRQRPFITIDESFTGNLQ